MVGMWLLLGVMLVMSVVGDGGDVLERFLLLVLEGWCWYFFFVVLVVGDVFGVVVKV